MKIYFNPRLDVIYIRCRDGYVELCKPMKATNMYWYEYENKYHTKESFYVGEL